MKKYAFLICLFSWQLIFSQTDHTASLVGDYYDNRDGNHANMPIAPHPGLTYMSSGYGIQNVVIPDTIVFGNASLAYTTGDNWGSLTRVQNLRHQAGMTRAYDLYVNNNAYWYPEHHDHDEVDYYFAQAPMINNSQGSSGSEIDEMHKWFYTLDAFSASTKDFLKAQKLLIPTMQMIARRSRVASDEEYLTGIAHPNAFDNADVVDEMTAMAAAMTPGTVPPMVQLEVVEEDYNLDQNEDNYWFFEPVIYPLKKEKMHETPVSITRIWHGLQYTKRIVVSAENSYDANDLPLTYAWAVLRGDTNHVSIHPLNDNHSIVEILIDYHPEDTIPETTKLSNLVSIGAFVNNGYYYSAPAFITSYTKRNEVRVYNETNGRLESITYNDNYLDPYLSTEKNWDSDVFTYSDGGTLLGWTRYNGDTQNKFTVEGYVVDEEDNNGNPTMVSKVVYKKIDSKTNWERQGPSFDYMPVGVQEYMNDGDVLIFPNPVDCTHFVNIHIDNCHSFSPVIVELYDMKGGLLQTVSRDGCLLQIDVSKFNTGNYLLKISYTATDKVERIIQSRLIVE